MTAFATGRKGCDAPGHIIPFGEAVRTWLRIALLSFGGPAGQIALMHRILVEEKRWIGENRFLHALNYCMLLPGPEAQQLAIYIGWLLHKTKGGLLAGALFVLPGFLSILVLSYIYFAFGTIAAVAGIFFGLKAAVLAIVVQAVVRIGSRVLKKSLMIWISAAAFAAIFFFDVPFPAIILLAGLAGYAGAKAGVSQFGLRTGHSAPANGALRDEDSILGELVPEHAHPNLAWSVRISAILLAAWLAPVALLVHFSGSADVFSQIGMFFSKLAVVTFGGAYAVLAYVAQEAVQNFGWLEPGEMLDGLSLAETTPGPLIMVVQFVGFLAAARNAVHVEPVLAGTLGAILTTWVTFVPCFLWIFLGAPFIEKLRSNVALGGAMSAITAAVVGVILNLAIWFALHAMFTQTSVFDLSPIRVEIPVWATVDWAAVAMTSAALIAVFRLQWPIGLVLGGSAFAGLAWTTLFTG
jgi:chromate transporter